MLVKATVYHVCWYGSYGHDVLFVGHILHRHCRRLHIVHNTLKDLFYLNVCSIFDRADVPRGFGEEMSCASPNPPPPLPKSAKSFFATWETCLMPTALILWPEVNFLICVPGTPTSGVKCL